MSIQALSAELLASAAACSTAATRAANFSVSEGEAVEVPEAGDDCEADAPDEAGAACATTPCRLPHPSKRRSANRRIRCLLIRVVYLHKKSRLALMRSRATLKRNTLNRSLHKSEIHSLDGRDSD